MPATLGSVLPVNGTGAGPTAAKQFIAGFGADIAVSLAYLIRFNGQFSIIQQGNRIPVQDIDSGTAGRTDSYRRLGRAAGRIGFQLSRTAGALVLAAAVNSIVSLVTILRGGCRRLLITSKLRILTSQEGIYLIHTFI